MPNKVKTANRTIHPASHKSKNAYRVKIRERGFYDQLVVKIMHENNDFKETYIFDGEAIAPYESIHFNADEHNGEIKINWVQDIKFTMQ
jgi:hypothetical protein